MKSKIWDLKNILLMMMMIMEIFLVVCRSEAAAVQEKAESGIPITNFSPPEGNTTFLGGTTWCVARPGVAQVDLQQALDWACGPQGSTDCTPIQSGGACFQPDTLLSHASYAFNSYYQQNGNSDIACNFGGSATLTRNDPSYGKCNFDASGDVSSSSPPSPKMGFILWELLGIIMFLLFWRS